MALQSLNDEQSPFFESAWELYTSAFPESERHSRSWFLEALKREPAFHASVFPYGGQLGALLFFWRTEYFVYVEHLAVTPSIRGRGLGKGVLSLLSGNVPVILEIEPVVDEVTMGRLQFYERAGFSRLPYPHCQPPYHPNQKPLPMELLCRGSVDEKLWQRFETWLASVMVSCKNLDLSDGIH